MDFCIQACQQGQRLKKYRLSQNKWMPARFSLALFNQEGEILASSTGEKFSCSLIYTGDVLKAGIYTLLLVPVWNEHAVQDQEHKDVRVEILSPVSLSMKKVDETFEVLKSCLKNYARNFLPADERKPLKGIEGAWSALSLGIQDMWIGMIYVRNDSAENFTYSVKPSLKGAHVLSYHSGTLVPISIDESNFNLTNRPVNAESKVSPDEEDFIAMSLDSGTDEIIVLKRTEGSISVAISTRLQRQ
jgi:hypothetical protein